MFSYQGSYQGKIFRLYTGTKLTSKYKGQKGAKGFGYFINIIHVIQFGTILNKHLKKSHWPVVLPFKKVTSQLYNMFMTSRCLCLTCHSSKRQLIKKSSNCNLGQAGPAPTFLKIAQTPIPVSLSYES